MTRSIEETNAEDGPLLRILSPIRPYVTMVTGPASAVLRARSLNDSELARRSQETPLYDARIGAEAMKAAGRRDDPVLGQWGAAMLTAAVVKASSRPDVASDVVQQVVDVAREAFDGQPTPSDIPHLSDDTVARAGEIMTDFELTTLPASTM